MCVTSAMFAMGGKLLAAVACVPPFGDGCAALEMMRAERQQEDNRNRDSDGPEQDGTHG
jgi:hypothetical protein